MHSTAAARCISVTDALGHRTTTTYDRDGRPLATINALGFRTSVVYNAIGEVLAVIDARGNDPANNPIQVGRANGSVATWTYDAIYELTGEAQVGIANFITTYTYDRNGNCLTQWESTTRRTLTYDAANQLSEWWESILGLPPVISTSFQYDGCGNRLKDLSLSPTLLVHTYTWDGENRMVEAAIPRGVVDTFTFNADGQRVGRTDTTGSVNYVWDGQNVLIETNASNVIEAVHTLEPRYYGNQVSQFRSGVASYYHYDLQGSTLHLTNAAGTLANTYVYDAWGNLQTSAGSTVNPYQYIGRKGYIYDSDLDNFQVRARRYDPANGRWWSRDQVAFESFQDGLQSGWSSAGTDPRVLFALNPNPFLYSSNSPISLYDPAGLANEAASSWEQTGWWNLNPFAYGPFRVLPNYLGGVYGRSAPPSLAVSLVPVVGPIRQTAVSFQSGNDAAGAAYLAAACADLEPAKSVASSIIRGTAWKFGNTAWNRKFVAGTMIPGVRDWLGRRGFARPLQPVHHWALHRNEGIGKNDWDSIKNQTWILIPMPSQAVHNLVEGKGSLAAAALARGPVIGPIQLALQRWWYGTLGWFKALPASAAGRAPSSAVCPLKDSK